MCIRSAIYPNKGFCLTWPALWAGQVIHGQVYHPVPSCICDDTELRQCQLWGSSRKLMLPVFRLQFFFCSAFRSWFCVYLHNFSWFKLFLLCNLFPNSPPSISNDSIFDRIGWSDPLVEGSLKIDPQGPTLHPSVLRHLVLNHSGQWGPLISTWILCLHLYCKMQEC